MLDIRITHALAKLRPEDSGDSLKECGSDIAARGEVFSFCAAVRMMPGGLATVKGDFADLPGQVRVVEAVPCHFNGANPDADMISTAPGLYPDLLLPLEDDNSFRIISGQWRMLWCTIRIPAAAAPGRRKFRIIVTNPLDGTAATGVFTLDVASAVLPEQTIWHNEWFHADCLSAWYRVESWSPEHWRIVENFARNAVEHGINILYTPLWTPPLDTGVGLRRPDCQLLGIALDPVSGRYRFDFTRLRRYLEMGLRLGFKGFAMSHLFTQWGAKATPCIRVEVNGVPECRFGWDVASDSREYADFLRQLLPELLKVLREYVSAERCFFSLSDEPHLDHLPGYRKLVELVRPLLEEFPTLEALSNYEYYRQDLVRNPVVALNHIEEFRGRIDRLWTYYCVSQSQLVPNRFIAMPSRRTRIFGILAYVYDLSGFLHWGFNFYYSQYSRRLVNPFLHTDADGAFPAGDPFIVYPGADGEPLDSIRNEVLFAGFQDLRLMQALEKKIGRPATLELLQQGLPEPLSMSEYPRCDEWLLAVRRRILAALA